MARSKSLPVISRWWANPSSSPSVFHCRPSGLRVSGTPSENIKRVSPRANGRTVTSSLGSAGVTPSGRVCASSSSTAPSARRRTSGPWAAEKTSSFPSGDSFAAARVTKRSPGKSSTINSFNRTMASPRARDCTRPRQYARHSAAKIHSACVALAKHLQAEMRLATMKSELSLEQWLALSDRSVKWKESCDRALSAIGLDPRPTKADPSIARMTPS